MARKKNNVDPLGGFSLDQLLGLDPISNPKKKGIVSKALGLPFKLLKAPVLIVQRLVGGVINAVLEIVKLPVRMLGGLASPWRSK